MVPTLFFYPIVLLALVWLFLMLRVMWSSDRGVECRPLPKPVTLWQTPVYQFREPKTRCQEVPQWIS